MKDKEPLQKAKVSQEYLELNGEAQGITCHSASPACIGWSINSIKYPTAKDYKLLYKERPDMLRLGVSCLYRDIMNQIPGTSIPHSRIQTIVQESC